MTHTHFMNVHLQEFQEKCNKILDLLRNDLATIKTGRAKPSLIENVKVNAYNTWMEVRELASITAPDAQTIVITPWDKTIMKDLVKGIAGSEANLNPVVNGEIIRITIPPLTEESRRDLVKLVNQKLESHKTMLRQERQHFKNEIEAEKNTAGVSEDDVKRDLEQLQKITDDTISKIDVQGKEKEEELMRL